MNESSSRANTRTLVESLLSKTEAVQILSDATAPADLFAAAFSLLWNCNWEAGLQQGGPWDDSLIAALSDARAKSVEAVEEIVPMALMRVPDRVVDAAAQSVFFRVGKACLEYLSNVSVSEHVLKNVVDALWNGVGAAARGVADARLPGIALCLAARVKAQAAKRTIKGTATAAASIRSLEAIYGRPEWWQRTYPRWAVAPADDVLPNVLNDIWPDTSPVLVSRAVELATLGWERVERERLGCARVRAHARPAENHAGLQFAATDVVKLHSWALSAARHLPSPEVWSEDAIDQLLGLKAEVVDTELGRNPRLTDAQRWRIYSRYLNRGKAYTAGRILAQWSDVRKHIEEARDTHGAAGVMARGCQVDPRGKWITPVLGALALRSPYVVTQSSHSEATGVKYEVLISYLYRHLPQRALAEALPSGDASMALALVGAWKQSPRDGQLLDELFKYPSLSVQLEFLQRGHPANTGTDTYWRLKASEIKKYRGERRRIYCERVLPQLSQSKLRSVRTLARRLTARLARAKERGDEVLTQLVRIS